MSTAAVTKRRYGNPLWDVLLRISAGAGLAAIPLVLVWPSSGPLVGFLLVTLWLNGPLAPFFPASYEPVLMIMGRFYSPLLVAALGIAGTLFIEFLNYHLYRKVLHSGALTGARRSRAVAWIVRTFARAPFFTVWLCSWSPLPYWAVRFLSPLAGYAVTKHLWATFLGRFPRLLFFAALGAWWNVDVRLLVMISVVLIAVAVVLALRWRLQPSAVGEMQIGQVGS